jgi:dsDNA-specific endonuclease/ATPase MutS2
LLRRAEDQGIPGSNEYSLVLLDELGRERIPPRRLRGGPREPAGKGCVSVVTTHHNVLKPFGAGRSGAVNAAMEFDPATLQPT